MELKQLADISSSVISQSKNKYTCSFCQLSFSAEIRGKVGSLAWWLWSVDAAVEVKTCSVPLLRVLQRFQLQDQNPGSFVAWLTSLLRIKWDNESGQWTDDNHGSSFQKCLYKLILKKISTGYFRKEFCCCCCFASYGKATPSQMLYFKGTPGDSLSVPGQANFQDIGHLFGRS